MAVASMPNALVNVPADTPADIVRAVRVAESCRFCQFLGDLERGTADGEYVIEASVGPERQSLSGGALRWFRVRFLIPERFPYAVAHAVPLDPDLRWNPHQNGDYPELGDHANVMCPPRQSEIHLEELLLPYIRHAYRWTRDAADGHLSATHERYEFPHLLTRSDKDMRIYVEGGRDMLTTVNGLGHGRALLHRVENAALRDGLFRVAELRRPGEGDDPEAWRSSMRQGVFGKEEPIGWAPWAFVGVPVIEAPHRPPIEWEDFSGWKQRNIVAALEDAAIYEHRLPVLLLAFAVPRTWGGTPKSVVWQAIDLLDFGPRIFVPPEKGFRPTADPRRWPRFREFVRKNRDLRWTSCRDVSGEALAIRSMRDRSDGAGRMQVAVLGVGAVGSVLARSLSKVGFDHLLLVDKERLEPGNLVRHEGVAFQVERYKASSTAALLAPAQGGEPEGVDRDVVAHWPEVVSRIAGCDLIIDATGDIGVHEILSSSPELRNAALAWCYVKPGPDYGLLALRRPGSSSTLADAERRLQERLGTDSWERFRGEPGDEDRVVWPEPGCYDPTFSAPYHRIRMMADAFTATLLAWLNEGDGDLATIIRQTEPEGYLGIQSTIEAQLRW